MNIKNSGAMIKQIAIVFLVAVMFQNLACYGQNLPDSTKTLRVETIDGNIFLGYVIAEDSLTLVLMTENLGEIKIPQVSIKSKVEIKAFKKVGGNIWLPNPQSARYFWAPDGYGLEKGSSY